MYSHLSRSSHASRRRLIASARELIAQRGYHQTSVAEIGAFANMSRSAVSLHFGGKAAMLDAVIDDAVARWQTLLATARGPNLIETLDHVWAGLQDDPLLFRSSLSLLHAAMGPAPEQLPRARQELRRLRDAAARQITRDQLQGRAARDSSPDALATLLTAALTTAALELLVDQPQRAGAAYAAMRATIGARLEPPHSSFDRDYGAARSL